MDLSLCNTALWRLQTDRAPRAEAPLYPVSDKILCDEIRRINVAQAYDNARDTCPQWHDLSEEKDFAAEGQLLVARRAGCGDVGARSNSGPAGGWLMSVCPRPTYANNVVGAGNKVCAPRHQAFMNQTRRGTGTEWGAKPRFYS